MHKYTIEKSLGRGSSCEVFRAKEIATGKQVAIKSIQERFVGRADINEMESLRTLKNDNIIALKEVCCDYNSVQLVLELCVLDLHTALQSFPRFGLGQKKTIMKHIFSGLAHCHSLNIIHRDIKPINILINTEGVVKLADFGLSRSLNEPSRPLSPDMVTRWYRAPEILLGSRTYGRGVDMWSAGLVLWELFAKKPVLPGTSEIDQLHQILSTCGSITQADWPEVTRLPQYNAINLPSNLPREVRVLCNRSCFCTWTIDLIEECLQLNPRKRITAADAVGNKCFRMKPLAECIKFQVTQYIEQMK